MSDKIIFPYQSIQPVGSEKKLDSSSTALNSTASFKSLLKNEVNGEVKFSKHAQERLKARNIKLNEEDLQKLQNAVDKARAKGAKDSLILLNNLALIVSVRNNTVITAVNEENVQDNVFTNIDSAIIV